MAIHEKLWGVITRLLPADTLALGYPDFWFGDEKDAYKMFSDQGSKLTCVDRKTYDGREIIADLNEPQDFGKFGLVLDHGTLEHCCNIGQAIKNAVSAVRVGGHILHTAPVTMVNHGYFNFSPIFFHDFYELNGFEVLAISGIDMDHKPARITFDHKFTEMGRNITAVVVARRIEDLPVMWPIQGPYR